MCFKFCTDVTYLGIYVRHPIVLLKHGQVKYITVATQHTQETKGLYMLCCECSVIHLSLSWLLSPPKPLIAFYIDNKFQLRLSVIKMDLILFLFSVFLSRKTN